MERHKSPFTLGKAIVYMGSIILGIYASDLHKLLLNVCLFFQGNNAFSDEHGRILDAAVALFCAFNALLVVFLKPGIGRFINAAVFSQLIILTLLSFSLWNSYDMISLEHYARFVAGNLLIFFAAIAICRTPHEIRRVWVIWIFTSVCLSIISICLFGAGINWSSARSAAIPGVNVRPGYFSAISIVYLFANLSIKPNLKNFFILLVMIILGLGILTSGSKGSLILASLGIGIYLLVVFFSELRVPKHVIFITLLITLVIVFAIHLKRFESAGAVGATIDPQRYHKSIQGRIEIAKHYLNLALASPIFGNGISASYSLEKRTHSVLLALFVQIGVVGLLAHIVFLISLLLKGLRLVGHRNRVSRNLKKLSIIIFIALILLIIKSEITSDVPGNRELWLFAGMLLSIYGSRRVFSTQATGEKDLITDDAYV
jgi:O-antigen ligase